MKRALLVAALVTFTFGAFAQTATSADTTVKKHKRHHKAGDTTSKMLDSSKKM